ncbi:MAG TPA: hypothetical protein RMG48_07230, partial [Myxococcales bacterium LLY-WYZ-16_1]|nr:hypothetical protein [Myxococcales bacterium LLY-WYZ-16_1]
MRPDPHTASDRDALSGYELLHDLGFGQRTVAHAARNPRGELCAVRLLRPGVAPEPIVSSFERGASALWGLPPPPVTSGFFETPLVWADPLSLRPNEAIPVTAAVELAVGVAECLATCPERSHANLKESHILVDDRGTVSLIDPDPTHRGWVGTRAPEQSEGVVGPGTDVYALGCLLFGWCTGEAVPTSPVEEAVRNEKVQNMSRYGLPLQLQLLLRRMLRADPQDRLPGAEAAAEALRLVNLEDDTSNLKMWLAGSRWLRTGFWIRLRAHQETLDDPPVDLMEPTEVELKPGAFDTWTDEARDPGLRAAARPKTTGKRPHSEPEARSAAAPADRRPTAPSGPNR